MTSIRTREILRYDFDVPARFYTVPLSPDEALGSAAWAQSITDDVLSGATEPGEPGDIVDQLVDLRTRLIGRGNPWLTAAVSVRPEHFLSIGALVLAEQLTMDADDGPDAFERLVREQATRMRPGARSRELQVWRHATSVGEVVGMFQRVDLTELDSETGRLSQRTLFGIFPDESQDMIQLTFTTEDFGEYADMRAETQAVVDTLSVKTGKI